MVQLAPKRGPIFESQLRALLIDGGDERIALDPVTGLNRYGCGAEPETDMAAFSSSTASVISPGAYVAAQARLAALGDYSDPREAYAAEAQGVRERLTGLCGLTGSMARNIVLGASGTDLHLIVADLARGRDVAPLVTVMADPSETGRGVPDALRGVRYSAHAPHGGQGSAGGLLAGATAGTTLSVPLRQADGNPRTAQAIDEDFEHACRRAARLGGPMLLASVDVSKTGLMAPSPACAAALKGRYGERLTVLVDACQFRLSVESLQDYLAQDFVVALTGSKFLGGPAFSGALLLPESVAARWRAHPLLPALADYSGRHDWPAEFAARRLLPDSPNLGLLLRWEAALHEFDGFRKLCPNAVRGVLQGLAEAIETALEDGPGLEPFLAPPLHRFATGRWDGVPTIFPFLLPAVRGVSSPTRTLALHDALHGQLRLGQPVALGVRDGEALKALRVCVSARHVVESLGSEAGRQAVLARAKATVAACAIRAAAL